MELQQIDSTRYCQNEQKCCLVKKRLWHKVQLDIISNMIIQMFKKNIFCSVNSLTCSTLLLTIHIRHTTWQSAVNDLMVCVFTGAIH